MGTYHNFHRALRQARGKANENLCATEGCARRAVEWAWDHTGPSVSEKVPSFGLNRLIEFSLDPERYLPLCKSCHVRLDLRTDPGKFPCGHARSEENTYIRPSGSTYCRACHREREREARRA